MGSFDVDVLGLVVASNGVCVGYLNRVRNILVRSTAPGLSFPELVFVSKTVRDLVEVVPCEPLRDLELLLAQDLKDPAVKAAALKECSALVVSWVDAASKISRVISGVGEDTVSGSVLLQEAYLAFPSPVLFQQMNRISIKPPVRHPSNFKGF